RGRAEPRGTLPPDPPPPARLRVHQHLPARVPRRVEVEPALGREVQVRADVADQELVGETLAGERLPEQPPDRGVPAVAADQPAGTPPPVAPGPRRAHRDPPPAPRPP